MEFERLGRNQNHIHLLCDAHPKISPGRWYDCSKVSQGANYGSELHHTSDMVSLILSSSGCPTKSQYHFSLLFRSITLEILQVHREFCLLSHTARKTLLEHYCVSTCMNDTVMHKDISVHTVGPMRLFIER